MSMFDYGFDHSFGHITGHENYGHVDFSHHENILGGQDYETAQGHFSTVDNIHGGHDYMLNGSFHGHSEPNIMGGNNYYDEHNHMVAHTEDNGIGGMAVYDENGIVGNFTHSFFSNTFSDFQGGVHHFDHVETGNGGYIMNFDDPLEHISSYIMPDLIL